MATDQKVVMVAVKKIEKEVSEIDATVTPQLWTVQTHEKL